jgi:hypothetical protein
MIRPSLLSLYCAFAAFAAVAISAAAVADQQQQSPAVLLLLGAVLLLAIVDSQMALFGDRGEHAAARHAAADRGAPFISLLLGAWLLFMPVANVAYCGITDRGVVLLNALATVLAALGAWHVCTARRYMHDGRFPEQWK